MGNEGVGEVEPIDQTIAAKPFPAQATSRFSPRMLRR